MNARVPPADSGAPSAPPPGDSTPRRGMMAASTGPTYVPAILCAEFDSPIDALVALCVPRDEAMDLVAASWQDTEDIPAGEACSILATVDGGRHVAAVPTPERRWAACLAFPEHRATTLREAERQLAKLLKRGRRGYVARLPDPHPIG